MEDLSVTAAYLSSRGTAVAASSAASASALAASRTSYSSLFCADSCFTSSPTPQSSFQQDSAAPQIQRQILPSPAAVRIHKPAWSSRYPAVSASAYSSRIYSTLEEELNTALDRILSGSLREVDNKGGGVNPMTAKLRGQGGRCQQHVEGVKQ